MAKKRQEDPPAGSPAWMATFSDLMNLLFCFFVLLFSMSSVDAQKFEQVVASFSKTFSIFSGGATAVGDGMLISNGVSQLNELDEYVSSMGKAQDGSQNLGAEDSEAAEQVEAEKLKESEELAEKITEAIQEEKMQEEVNVEFTSQYVLLTLNGALLFDSGSAKLKDEAATVMAKVGLILERYAESVIEVEGHTDNVPMNTAKYENNNELSSARALSVFDFLVDSTSLNPANIKHSGRGEYVPIADNAEPEGRAKNRRVEIKVYHTLSSY